MGYKGSWRKIKFSCLPSESQAEAGRGGRGKRQGVAAPCCVRIADGLEGMHFPPFTHLPAVLSDGEADGAPRPDIRERAL
jgi:hypothetical protein